MTTTCKHGHAVGDGFACDACLQKSLDKLYPSAEYERGWDDGWDKGWNDAIKFAHELMEQTSREVHADTRRER